MAHLCFLAVVLLSRLSEADDDDGRAVLCLTVPGISDASLPRESLAFVELFCEDDKLFCAVNVWGYLTKLSRDMDEATTAAQACTSSASRCSLAVALLYAWQLTGYKLVVKTLGFVLLGGGGGAAAACGSLFL